MARTTKKKKGNGGNGENGIVALQREESKDFTYRLCRMNLIIHRLGGDIKLGDSYFDDKFASLKADWVLAP